MSSGVPAAASKCIKTAGIRMYRFFDGASVAPRASGIAPVKKLWCHISFIDYAEPIQVGRGRDVGFPAPTAQIVTV